MADTHYLLNTKGLSSEDFGGEMVAVNFETGEYYGINGAAVVIWQLLHKPVSKPEIASRVKGLFDSVPEKVAKDVDGFIEELSGHNLLISGNADELAGQQTETSEELPNRFSGTTYVRPSIEIYSDLQELIMLDPVHEVDPEKGWPLRREDPSSDTPNSGKN